MKFWTSGEVHGDVGDTTIRLQKNIEKKINDNIENKNYGQDITFWGFMSIVLPNDLLPAEFFQEIKRYRKNKKETEFRLKIDYDQLVKADEKGIYRLICESILRSIEIARAEFKVSKFDLDAFESDLKKCFKEENWI